ncbi:hypothetical protein ACUTJJ_12630 [Agrobacterium sp. DKPNP3]|uniref:hypothetical protein n=1 Tax=Agrobacterium sp. DKPNP3 TaxID=3457323 RepID=UPI004044D19B
MKETAPSVAVKALTADDILAGIKDQRFGYVVQDGKLTVGTDRRIGIDLDVLAAFLSRAALSAQVQDVARWQDISTAPKVKENYFFCRLAWGPENDRSTGDEFRWNGRWFAVGTFYKGKRFDECQYEMRQIEVQPSHWMPLAAAPAKQEG